VERLIGGKARANAREYDRTELEMLVVMERPRIPESYPGVYFWGE
jgi:hypothetical protein